MALAKLEARLRRACDRRKDRRAAAAANPCGPGPQPQAPRRPMRCHQTYSAIRWTRWVTSPRWSRGRRRASDGEESAAAHLVPIQMEGECPVVVREKLHHAEPMTIDQALLEMELVGHDFFLFHDRECDQFSVVYRRPGL